MAYSLNGSNQYLSATAPIDGLTKPFTLACWFNSTTVTANQYLVTLCPVSGQAWGISAHGGLANDPILAIQTGASTFSTTSAYSANTWTHACGVFNSTTSRTAYKDAVAGSTATSLENAATAATQVIIGSIRASGNFSQYLNGLIAEVGIWNAALTADEIASLADGFTCDKVRPQSLVFYAPLIRDLQDVRGGLTITNNNTATVANHPRVYA
jgi:hypothetical protein